MSSAGRAASSSGCVGRPRGHETGLTGYPSKSNTLHPLAALSWKRPNREPYESRGSRTDLGAPGGESPPGDSTNLAARSRFQNGNANGRKRRVSLVPPNPGERLLSEPTAVTRPRRRELVFMSSRPEDSHLWALPDPYVNLSVHTAPDVRPFP